MIPLLYDKTNTEQYGALKDCIECLVTEERNGILEVVLTYPNNNDLAQYLINENIIVCDANDTLKNQQFRIYETVRLMSNKIEVHARHISFDLAYDFIKEISIENQSCEYALNTIFRNSQFSTNYKGYSDIINTQDYNVSRCNCLEAIAGKSGSIIDTFGTGAEILRDNTDIYVYEKRGRDNGVSIEYAKNLTGFELEEDHSELITRIIPYAKYTDNETSEDITVEGEAVNSDLIYNYSHPYTSYMDFSEKFEDGEIPTSEQLTAIGEKYFKNNSCDKPKQNFKIEFIPLSKCIGYEDIEDKISLCDIVTIKDTRYGIDTKAKVIKTVYDVLRDRYDSMELGEPRTTLGDIINTGGNQQGEQGPPGPPGPPGADGEMGDFPDSLPSTPILSATVYGFSTIELSWTFDDKVYYTYELYANKTKDFTPNTFDLIHSGQSSSFLFQANPDETWYFRVRAINTHGRATAFSEQIQASTAKISDLSNYVKSAAIGDALIGTLSLDRGWFGTLRGHYIDAKQLSVTNGSGIRTLDIDSHGNVSLNVATLKIESEDVATESTVNSKITQSSSNILSTVSSTYVSDSDASKTYATKSELNQTSESWAATFESGFTKGIVEMNQYGIKVTHSDFAGWTHMTSSGVYINNGEEDVIQLTTSGLQIEGAIKGGSTIDIGTSDDGTRSAFQVASNGVVGIGNTITLNGVTYPAFRVGKTGNLKVGGASAYIHPADGMRKGIAEITSLGTVWSCSEKDPYTYARLTEGKLEISNTGYDPNYNGGSYVKDSYIKLENGQIAIYAASDTSYSNYVRSMYLNQEGIGSSLGQVNFLNRINVTGDIYATSAIVINRNANAFRGVDTDGGMVSLVHVGSDNVSKFGYGSWDADSSLCYDAGTQFLGGSTATLRSKGVTLIGCNENKYIRFAYNGTDNYVFRPNDQNKDIYCGTKNYQWYICYALNGCETGSDRTLKENIQYLDYYNINTKAIINNSINTQDCLDFITNDYLLATYNYISDNKKSTKLSAIAQDIIVNEDGSDNIIGQLIVNAKESTDEEAPLTMNQTQLLNVAIGAIQQLNVKVNELENRLKNS